MAASLSYLACYTIRCSWDPSKIKLGNIKINGTGSISTASTKNAVANSSVAPPTENGHIAKEQIRQNIPTKKQIVDPYRQGLIIEEGVGYRQTFVIRSYEVGADKTATLESLLNLLQVKTSFHLHYSCVKCIC